MSEKTELLEVVPVDIGKSGIRGGRVSRRNSTLTNQAKFKMAEEIQWEYQKPLCEKPLVLADVVAAIRRIVQECQIPISEARVVVTYPLPIDPNGRIEERKELPFLGRMKPSEVEHKLLEMIGLASVTLCHDSHAQLKYVLEEYSPKKTFAVLACGTSFAFALASPQYPDAFEGLTSTFSHAPLGGDGPVCENCGDKCIGAWYKQLYKTKQDTSPAVCRAVSVAVRLSISELFVTGGAMKDKRIRDALDGLQAPLANATVKVVDEPAFSGAIGAALTTASALGEL